jgi:hypothetical protein
MQPPREELTEKQLAENFEKINDEIQEKAREYSVEQCPPITVPDEESLVVEPVYAYEVHASS